MVTHSNVLAWRTPWPGTWQAAVHGATKSQSHTTEAAEHTCVRNLDHTGEERACARLLLGTRPRKQAETAQSSSWLPTTTLACAPTHDGPLLLPLLLQHSSPLGRRCQYWDGRECTLRGNVSFRASALVPWDPLCPPSRLVSATQQRRSTGLEWALALAPACPDSSSTRMTADSTPWEKT